MKLDMRNDTDRGRGKLLRVCTTSGDMIKDAFAFDTEEGWVKCYAKNEGTNTLKTEPHPDKPGERRPIIVELRINFDVVLVNGGETVASFRMASKGLTP